MSPITPSGKTARGFTLIELLVVIAIIGVLSAIVLVALNTARDKGNDTAIRSGVAGARPQAELFYDANNNSYLGVCGTTPIVTANGTVKTINAQITAAAQDAGVTAALQINAKGVSKKATCNATSSGWAAEVPLKSVNTSFYCVDSQGQSATTSASTLTSTTDVACN